MHMYSKVIQGNWSSENEQQKNVFFLVGFVKDHNIWSYHNT